MTFNTLHRFYASATGLYWNFAGIKLMQHYGQYGSLLLLFFCNMRETNYLCYAWEHGQSWQNHLWTSDASSAITSKDTACTIPLLFSNIYNWSSLKMYHMELFSCSLMVSLICIGHFALLASTFLFSDVSPMSFISSFSKGKAFKFIIFFYRIKEKKNNKIIKYRYKIINDFITICLYIFLMWQLYTCRISLFHLFWNSYRLVNFCKPVVTHTTSKKCEKYIECGIVALEDSLGISEKIPTWNLSLVTVQVENKSCLGIRMRKRMEILVSKKSCNWYLASALLSSCRSTSATKNAWRVLVIGDSSLRGTEAHFPSR